MSQEPTRQPRRFVKMFQPRFARLVESGAKQQTVRGKPKRMPQPGDHLSLREWTGKPYRSKQREITQATVLSVHDVEIHVDHMRIDGAFCTNQRADAFAQADGFRNFDDLVGWFTENYAAAALPFEGICITWYQEGGGR